MAYLHTKKPGCQFKRLKCWESRAKVKNYDVMIGFQNAVLEHNIRNKSDTKGTAKVIKDMEIKLHKWLVVHKRNHQMYVKELHKVVNLRDEIMRMESDIEEDVCKTVAEAIIALMRTNKQEINDTEIFRIAGNLYLQACHTYTFEIFMADCGNI